MNEELKKLANDIDLKELFERQSDLRTLETLGLSVLALATSSAALTLINMSSVVTQALVSFLIFSFIGVGLHGVGRVFRFRLSWLRERIERAARRLRDRNTLPDEFSYLDQHHAFEQSGSMYVIEIVRLRWRFRIVGPFNLVGLLEPVGIAMMGVGATSVIGWTIIFLL